MEESWDDSFDRMEHLSQDLRFDKIESLQLEVLKKTIISITLEEK